MVDTFLPCQNNGVYCSFLSLLCLKQVNPLLCRSLSHATLSVDLVLKMLTKASCQVMPEFREVTEVMYHSMIQSQERTLYEAHQKYLMDKAALIDDAYEDGMEAGIEIGREDGVKIGRAESREKIEVLEQSREESREEIERLQEEIKRLREALVAKS